VALVLSKLDYCNECNGVLTGLPATQLNRLQSSPSTLHRDYLWHSLMRPCEATLRQLHWLSSRERVEFKLYILGYHSVDGFSPDYLSSDFMLMSHLHPRQWLCLVSMATLVVPVTWRSTLGHCILPVTAAWFWNALLSDVTTANSSHPLFSVIWQLFSDNVEYTWLFWPIFVLSVYLWFLVIFKLFCSVLWPWSVSHLHYIKKLSWWWHRSLAILQYVLK